MELYIYKSFVFLLKQNSKAFIIKLITFAKWVDDYEEQFINLKYNDNFYIFDWIFNDGVGNSFT